MSIDWTNLYKKYKSSWIALKTDEKSVISTGKTAKEAWSKARKSGYKNPILTKMPAKLITYIGAGNEVFV